MQTDLSVKQVNLLNEISAYGAETVYEDIVLASLVLKGYVFDFVLTPKGEILVEWLGDKGYFCDGCGNMKNPDRWICLSCEMEIDCV